MLHNPETYALLDVRRFLRKGLENIGDPDKYEWQFSKNGLGNIIWGGKFLSHVLLPWNQKWAHYNSENGYLAIRENEKELFHRLGSLFDEFMQSCASENRFRLRMIRHPKWQEFVELAKELREKMIEDTLESEYDEVTTLFLVEAKWEYSASRKHYEDICDKVLALFPPEDYPFWYAEANRTWCESHCQPQSPEEFRNWMLDPVGHWFYGNYAFHRDQTHSVHMSGERFDNYLFFRIATRDLWRIEEFRNGIAEHFTNFIKYDSDSCGADEQWIG